MTAAEQAPRMSRRHAVGTRSARGLLLTVLGELVLPSGGSAWTSAFIDVLGRLEVEEKTCRQALMRTGADGWLASQRVGRRSCWQLTSNGVRLLREGTQRIYGFAGTVRDWDGRWILVIARAPEIERPARHLLRTRLAWAGLGSPAPGIWLSTHADRVAEVERVLAEAGMLGDAQIFDARHRGGSDLSALVRQAWDLDEIEARYEGFLTRFSNYSARDHLASMVELVHAWRKFPSIDPALPRELLPRRWSGVAAGKLFARRHAQWAAGARAEWQRIMQGPATAYPSAYPSAYPP